MRHEAKLKKGGSHTYEYEYEYPLEGPQLFLFRPRLSVIGHPLGLEFIGQT